MAIELFTTSQALDFRKPLKPGKGVAAAHNYVRSIVPHGDKDYYFKDDLSKCAQIVVSGDMVRLAEAEVGNLF